jgi:hypothetical protein
MVGPGTPELSGGQRSSFQLTKDTLCGWVAKLAPRIIPSQPGGERVCRRELSAEACALCLS